MTIVKAAAVQISPVLYSREGTVNKVVEKIIELGRQDVQFRHLFRSNSAVLSLLFFCSTAFSDGSGAAEAD